MIRPYPMTGAHSGSARQVTPDVAMNGDLYTSVLVGMSDGAPYGEGGYGGTSVSAPEFSAAQADAIQARHGRPIGFGNPAIYPRAGSEDFTDVRAGTLPLLVTARSLLVGDWVLLNTGPAQVTDIRFRHDRGRIVHPRGRPPVPLGIRDALVVYREGHGQARP